MFEWPHLLKVAIFHKSGFPANRVEPTHPVDMECPLTILNLCQRPLLKWTSEAQLQCRRVNWQHNLVEMIKLRSLSKSLWFSCTVPTTYKANNFVLISEHYYHTWPKSGTPENWPYYRGGLISVSLLSGIHCTYDGDEGGGMAWWRR